MSPWIGVVVSDNLADTGGSGRGGGIYVRESSLILLRSTVISNTAALVTPATDGSPVDRSTIIGSGGGIYALDSRLTVWQKPAGQQ